MIVCCPAATPASARRRAGYSYDLTMDDGNVAAGQTMYISANTLLAADGAPAERRDADVQRLGRDRRQFRRLRRRRGRHDHRRRGRRHDLRRRRGRPAHRRRRQRHLRLHERDYSTSAATRPDPRLCQRRQIDLLGDRCHHRPAATTRSPSSAPPRSAATAGELRVDERAASTGWSKATSTATAPPT